MTRSRSDNTQDSDSQADLEYVKSRNQEELEYDRYTEEAAPAETAAVEQSAPSEDVVHAEEGEAVQAEPATALIEEEGDDKNQSAKGPSEPRRHDQQGPRSFQKHGHGQARQHGQGGQQNFGAKKWVNNNNNNRPGKKTKTYQVTLDERFSDNPIDWVIAECCGERWNIDISRKRVKQLLAFGSIKLNGRVERFPNKQVQTADRIEITLPIEEIRQQNDSERPLPTIDLTEKDIIYIDNAIVVLNKPAGIPSQGTLDPTRDHAYEALRRYLEQLEGREVYLAIHHRLDSDTSGPLLFCRKKSFNKPVQELFSERTARKTYLALVALNQKLEKKEWQVDNFLARSKKHPMRMESVNSGGDSAQTSFRVLAQNEKVALIEACPHTGRMHQIRVHLSEAGLPILGDFIYADKNVAQMASRTMLHSWKLEITHPEDNRPICAEAPLPADFKALLDKLGLKFL